MMEKKCSEKKRPLVSIITVVYNDAEHIENTLQSIISQDYEEKEIIVIDGQSTDGTTEKVRAFGESISCLVSEPDKGVYDAMNKGIDQARGEWIIFMNSGDSFYATDVLSQFFSKEISDDYNILYGKTNRIYKDHAEITHYRATNSKEIMPECHQSIFFRRAVLLQNKYDLRFKICADANQFNQLKKQGNKSLFFPIVVSNYDCAEGISSTNTKQKFIELSQIRFNSFLLGRLHGHLRYIYFLLRKG